MATDGSLSLWGANGPVVWHSETSGLSYWYSGGVYSDYQTASSPPASASVGLIGLGLCGNSPLVGQILS